MHSLPRIVAGSLARRSSDSSAIEQLCYSVSRRAETHPRCLFVNQRNLKREPDERRGSPCWCRFRVASMVIFEAHRGGLEFATTSRQILPLCILFPYDDTIFRHGVDDVCVREHAHACLPRNPSLDAYADVYRRGRHHDTMSLMVSLCRDKGHAESRRPSKNVDNGACARAHRKPLSLPRHGES